MPDTDPRDLREPGSVTALFAGLRNREPEAVAALWGRYFRPLARVAAARLDPAARRSWVPEDVALDVILEFCRTLAGPDADRRFPRLASRANVWGILVCMTVRAAFDHATKESRRARVVAGESALGAGGPAGREPPPEFAAAVGELFARLADPEHPEQGRRLQAVARMVVEGYTHAEIARELGCSERTVGLKLKLIRKIWRGRADGGAP